MKRYIFAFLLPIFLFTCKNNDLPDISNLTSDVTIIRTELEMSKIQDLASFEQWIKNHPAFYKIYSTEVIPIYQGENKDSLYQSFNLRCKDSTTLDLISKVKNRFSEDNFPKKEIDKMYKYLKFYFPLFKNIPNIYTFVSEFSYQIFVFQDEDGRDGIGVGLDMFMSPEIDYKIINPENTNFSDYVTRAWNGAHLAKKIADIHIMDIIGEVPGHRLIDHMIHQGKALYIADLILPEVHDSIITEYTGNQLRWCLKNEEQIWSFFFDQKLFYESNPIKIGKYINPSPNSPDMPADAPGRTANFIGWQIVKSYMARFPETSIQELIDMKDYQAFLEKSKYKPKRG